MNDSHQDLEADRNNLLLFLWRNRKTVILITSTTALMAVIISLLMTPLFRSTAIVFPAATSTVSFSEQRNAKASSMDFGEEEQAEQLIQILQSARIRNRIVQKFDLMEHYEIASDDPNKNYKLGKEYNNHITFTRTRYGSIEISVLDRDKQLAANIAKRLFN